jgi:hypothetical protein
MDASGPAALACCARSQHEACGDYSYPHVVRLKSVQDSRLRLIQGLFEGFGCLGFPQSLEIGDGLDCAFTRMIGAHEWQWLVRSVCGLLLMSELGEPANDHAAAHRHREATWAPAQSSVVHPVNVAISLSQALTSAETVSRAITYA